MSEPPISIELNPRERRLYDRLRARVAPVEPGVPSTLRDLLLLLPDVSILLLRLVRDPRVPLADKLIALAGVGYLVSPIDLLPSMLLGPIGLVDDLLIITAALSRLLNRVHPDVVRSAWPGKGDALASIQRVTEWSGALLAGRVRGALGGPRPRA